MSIKEDLASIVCSEHIFDEPETLERYSKDYSFVQPRKPSWVVYPKNTEEVQSILKYANDHSIAVTPRSSGISFYGAGIPSQGGIVLDLTRMNRIFDIDKKDRNVKVEPGVTWPQLQTELEKHGMMVCNPLLPHPAKSVLTSCMEREPMLVPKGEHSEPFRTGEVVLANGNIFYLGTAIAKGFVGRSNPDCFIPSTRLFMGAQGTLGVITWANLSTVYLPTMDKLYFMPFARIEDVVEPIYRIQRSMLGNECLVLDSLNLAAMLAENGDKEFTALRDSLPPWTLILCLAAGQRLPEEKIAYEEEALKDIALELNFNALPTLPEAPGIHNKLLPLLRKAWDKDGYWRLRYKGSWHPIFFHTTLNRVPEFTKVINEVALKYRYPTRDIDFYLQPVERARICFYQYGFHCDPNDVKDVARVRSLYLEASERVVSMGGLFTTPYGPWADMVYSRTTTYTEVLKVAKDTLDPNKILNPGKLCF